MVPIFMECNGVLVPVSMLPLHSNLRARFRAADCGEGHSHALYVVGTDRLGSPAFEKAAYEVLDEGSMSGQRTLRSGWHLYHGKALDPVFGFPPAGNLCLDNGCALPSGCASLPHDAPL